MPIEARLSYLLDPSARLTAVGEEVLPLLGFSPADFLDGRVTLHDRIHADDQDVAAILFAPIEAPEPVATNWRLRHADGRIRCVRAVYRKMLAGGRLELDLLLQDAKSLPRTLPSHPADPILRAMLENSTDYIFVKDRNYVLTAASQTLTEFGPSATHWTELLGKTDYDIFPEAYADLYYRLDKQVFGGRDASEIQETLTRTGHRGWVDNRKYPIRDDHGEIVGLYGIARDITARVQTERALKESEALFHSLYTSMTEGVALHRIVRDGDGSAVDYVLLDVNPAYEAITGLRRLDVANRAASAVYGDTPYLAVFARVAESGLATHFETAYEPMGKVFAISVFPTGADQFATVFSDITERRRNYDALRASEQRFRALFDDLPRIAVQGYDRNRRVIYWNRASEALYGYTPDEAIGRMLEDLIIPDPMRADVVVAVDAWTAGGPPIPASELTLRRKDGLPVTVYSSHVMQRGADGEPEMYCIDVDLNELVSYRDHLERLVDDRTRELATAKTLAEAASKAKSTFLANMSHELRTPMNGVLGMIGLAKKRMQDPAGRQQLDKAEISARHLLGVLNDILDLSKIEADHLQLEATPFRLGAVLETLVTIVGDRAAEKGLRLRIDVPPGLTSRAFVGDPLRLGQILINLTSNAIKFSARDDIDLRFRIEDETPSAVRLRVEIEDRGIGISGEDRARLFNAFEQADGTMTRKYGGTGLGLAISKRLVGMMSGEIGVDSEIGRGSTFWFTVDLRVGAPAAASASTPPARTPGEARLRSEFAGVRVLLAEDEPINSEVIQLWLTEAGLVVDAAVDGQQAVDMARRTPYAAILMDVQMPRLNGLDATRAIRAGTINAMTPIIAMTANAFEQDRRQCIEAGMDDHVAKPADPALLLGKILDRLAGTPAR